MLIACAILGYFLFQAASDFDASDTLYKDQVTKLQELQNLPLYPEAANLKILDDQNKAEQEAVTALHQQLIPMAFPLEPMTPEQFQDKLNAAVKGLVEKADAAGVTLGDRFYLGFEKYRTTTPEPKAASALGRQLKCIELAVGTLIESKIASISAIKRDPLPEEPDFARPATAATAPSAPGRKAAAKPAVELLAKYPFEIQFVAEQTALRNALNALSRNAAQFFIIRPLSIKNENEKSPKKIDPTTDNSSAAKFDSEGRAAKPEQAAAQQMRYAFGAEKVKVNLRISSTVFTSNLPK